MTFRKSSVICNLKTVHRLYRAIGATCPCLENMLTRRSPLTPEEIEQIFKELMRMPIRDTLRTMNFISTSSYKNKNTLMVTLNVVDQPKCDLYIRVLGHFQPAEAERERQKLRERGI